MTCCLNYLIMWLKITSSTSRVFEEETAGFQEHPAELMVDVDSDSGVTMLEKAGVSDPECDNINGRTFMAVTLRNFISEKSTPKMMHMLDPKLCRFRNRLSTI